MTPLFAATLSLVPGTGHWVVGKRGKAAAFFAIDLGIVCTIFFFRSPIAPFLAFFVYLMVAVPAVLETYALAKGEGGQLSESKPYIVLLLLVTGFSALPLLWQSHVFSRRIKIAWSIAVLLLAVLFFSFLGTYGVRLFHEVKTQLG